MGLDSANDLPFTIYFADCCGNASNCLYPHTASGDDAAALKAALRFDHVFVEFKGNYRSINNFKRAVFAPFDCDNDHSENPSQWIGPADIAAMFPDVRFTIIFSRSHMKLKDGKSARPRFHVVFFIDPITDAEAYAAIKIKIQANYQFFDNNALDAARFFYGTPDPSFEHHAGSMTLTQHITEMESELAFANLGEVIPEGKRNATLYHFAVKVIKRFGDTNEAYERFTAEAEKCDPPLDSPELDRIWRSAQNFYKKVQAQPGYVSPEVYNSPDKVQWETPIPFDEYSLPAFPVDALPAAIGNYVSALAESTQTPVDMAASSALPIISVCIQGKFIIQPKADWSEPLSTYVLNVMEPSERKSAVENAMVRPLNRYESEFNKLNAAAIESSKMHKRIMERREKALEDQAAKGKVDKADLDKIAVELAEYRELKPLRLYVDDITTEKLTSVLADNDGRAAILSTEGGIFDTLAGIYTKNVNIDVILKGYSGDCIKVDRIGRSSESVMNPALTILLMVQPSVLSGLMQNGTFRGRGLTARFLYCIPASGIGKRKYRSTPVPDDVYRAYEMLIRNMLEDEYTKEPEVITLSPDADEMIEAFAEELEPKLTREYADIMDWAGKLVGNTLRIAGLLCRASVYRSPAFLDEPEPLVLDAQTMKNAIRIGKYFIEHARAAFALMGADMTVKQSKYVLTSIKKSGLVEFNRRDIMRLCRGLKKADEVQSILDHLTEYGYIALKDTGTYSGKGRPPAQNYLVNPSIYENEAVR